jgi:uncharacterized protein (PEP-CTERM system associated)
MVRGVRGVAFVIGAASVALGATHAVAQNAYEVPLPSPPTADTTQGGEAAQGGGFRSGRWTIRPFFEIREAFTDNAFLTDGGREWDLITTLSPGISVRGEGARVRLNFDYSLNADLYARNSSLNGLRNTLTGTGSVELVQRSIFIDVAASAGQDNNSAFTNGGQGSAIDRTLPTNARQNYSYSISPYWTARYGPWASSILRYRFAQFLSVDNSTTDVPSTITPLSNTTLHEGTASITSGENFSVVTWDLEGRYSYDHSADQSSLREESIILNGAYHFNNTYAGTASVGYDHISSNGFTSNLNEATWSVGLRYTPNERFTADFSYGHRFGGPSWSGDLQYQITPQTTFTVRYSEDVSTQQQLALQGLGFISTDPVSGQLIDNRTGLPFVGRDPRFDQNNQVFLQRQLDVSLRAIRGRNTFIINAFFTRRNTNVADVTTSNDEERSAAGSFVFTRSVSRVTDATASLYYSRTSNNGGGSGRTWRADASIRTQLNETLTATAGYAFIDNRSEGEQFFNNLSTGTYRENVVFVSLRKAF